MQQDARFTLDMPFIEKIKESDIEKIKESNIEKIKESERCYDEYGDLPDYARVVAKYCIPYEKKSKILEELENVGISGATVYYDLESLAKSLKKKHRIGVEEEPVSEQEKS